MLLNAQYHGGHRWPSNTAKAKGYGFCRGWMCPLVFIIIASQPYQALPLPKHMHTDTSVSRACAHASWVSVWAHRLFTAVSCAIKMLFRCAFVLISNLSILPLLPSFLLPLPCILLTGGRLFSSRHTWHPPFCQGCRGEAHRWLLSPVIPFSFQHQFSLWCADCADKMRAIAEGGICSLCTLFIFPLSICTCNDFYGLSVTLWWLGVSWSILVLAIHPPDGKFPNPL